MSQPAPPPDDELDVSLSDPGVRTWFEEHRADLQKSAYGQRILYVTLASTFVIGLAAYVVGYVLKSTSPAEPVGFLADLTYTLGFALWTAAVVVVLVEVIPEVKQRQIRRALEAYEASLRTRPQPKPDSSTRQP